MAEAARTPMARRWCFTIQKGHLESHTTLEEFEKKFRDFPPECKYLVFQQEVGANTGTHHIQGFIQFNTQKRATTVGNLLGVKGEAFTVAKGSPAANQKYCTKEETRKAGCKPFEYGAIPGGQGTRSDLKRCAESIQEKGLESAIDEHPDLFIKYARGMRELDTHYRLKKAKTTKRNVEVVILWGTSGSGKSWAAESYDAADSYALPDQQEAKGGTVWFNNYNGEKTLLIEDFEGKIAYRSLLRYLDHYPLQVQTKGGFVPAEWEMVIITSNINPNRWYDDQIDAWVTQINVAFNQFPSPLQRRIDRIVEFRGIYPASKMYVDGTEITSEEIFGQRLYRSPEQEDPVASSSEGEQEVQETEPWNESEKLNSEWSAFYNRTEQAEEQSDDSPEPSVQFNGIANEDLLLLDSGDELTGYGFRTREEEDAPSPGTLDLWAALEDEEAERELLKNTNRFIDLEAQEE